MEKGLYFTNWTSEDFICYWDSAQYTVKAGQTMLLPEYLARHFTKHLTDREMIKDGKKVNMMRKEYEDKCLGAEIQAENKVDLAIKMANTEEVKEEKKIVSRKRVVKEEEFDGLKDEAAK